MVSSYFENLKQSESKSVITLEKLKEFENSNKQKKFKFAQHYIKKYLLNEFYSG